MKKQINIIARCTAIILLVSALVFTAKAQQTNFSGTWKLNTGKSAFGNTPARAAAQMYIVVERNKHLSLTWVTIDAEDKETTSTLELPLDGTVKSALLPSGRTRSASISFSGDGRELIFNKSYSKANQPEVTDYTLKESWQLTDERKELHIELSSPEYTITAVYDRQ